MARMGQIGSLTIYLYPYDENPPHVHARGPDGRAKIRIDPPELMRGKLPARQLVEVLAWVAFNAERLPEAWARGQRGEDPAQGW